MNRILISTLLLVSSYALEVNFYRQAPDEQFEFFCAATEVLVIDSEEYLPCPIVDPTIEIGDDMTPEQIEMMRPEVLRVLSNRGVDLDLNLLLHCLRYHTASECEDREKMHPVTVNVVIGNPDDYIHECPYEFDECEARTPGTPLIVYLFVKGLGECAQVLTGNDLVLQDRRHVTTGITSLAGAIKVLSDVEPVSMTLEVLGGELNGKGWLRIITRQGLSEREVFHSLSDYFLKEVNRALASLEFEAKARASGEQIIRVTLILPLFAGKFNIQQSRTITEDIVLILPNDDNMRVGVGDEVVINGGGPFNTIEVGTGSTFESTQAITTSVLSLAPSSLLRGTDVIVTDAFSMDSASCQDSEITLVNPAQASFTGVNDFDNCMLTCQPGATVNFVDDAVLQMIRNSQLILNGCTVTGAGANGGTLEADATSTVDSTNSEFVNMDFVIDGTVNFDDTTVRDGDINIRGDVNTPGSMDVDNALTLINTDLTVSNGGTINLQDNGSITTDGLSDVTINGGTINGGEVDIRGGLTVNGAILDSTQFTVQNTANTRISGDLDVTDGSTLTCVDATLNNANGNPNGRIDIDASSGMIGIRCNIVGGRVESDGTASWQETTIRNAAVDLLAGSTTSVDELTLESTVITCAQQCTMNMNDQDTDGVVTIRGDGNSSIDMSGTFTTDGTSNTNAPYTIDTRFNLTPTGILDVNNSPSLTIIQPSSLAGTVTIDPSTSELTLGGNGPHSISGTVGGSGTLRILQPTTANLESGAEVNTALTIDNGATLNTGAVGDATIRGPFTINGLLRVGPNGNLAIFNDVTIGPTGEVTFVFDNNSFGSITTTGRVTALPGSRFSFDTTNVDGAFIPPNNSDVLTFWTADSFDIQTGAWPTTTLTLPGWGTVDVNLALNGAQALDAVLSGGGTASVPPTAPTGTANVAPAVPVTPSTITAPSTGFQPTGFVGGGITTSDSGDDGSPLAAILVPTIGLSVICCGLCLALLLWFLFTRRRDADGKEDSYPNYMDNAPGEGQMLDMMAYDQGQKGTATGIFAPVGTPAIGGW